MVSLARARGLPAFGHIALPAAIADHLNSQSVTSMLPLLSPDVHLGSSALKVGFVSLASHVAHVSYVTHKAHTRTRRVDSFLTRSQVGLLLEKESSKDTLCIWDVHT